MNVANKTDFPGLGKNRGQSSKPWKFSRLTFPMLGIFGALLFQSLEAQAARQVIALDRQWQIAEGKLDQVPAKFERTVPVPGLVDMAIPPFVEPGPKVADRKAILQKDPRRDAFWYRRTLTVTGPIPAVAQLKIGKAMFGSRVVLNGKDLGEHRPSFTPGFFDAQGALKTGENEVLIRVAADRDTVGGAYPSGFDFEKDRYIPGIFDSVELILCGTPHIVNAQVSPEISKEQAKIRIYLDGTQATSVELEIREAKSGQVAGQTMVHAEAGTKELDAVVPIKACRLWSPEDPFLYTLTVRTSGDEFATRFGMREFKFDPATGRALLNGKPYFLRGSNITLYRFFEDPARADLPWREDWVRQLHRRIKDMHWNSLRYCIGFPPELWYRIADEEGVLIQDEFPIWFGGKGWNVSAKELKTPQLVIEYTEWLRERWNHPCVAVWDASNETTTDETSPAVAQVRGLDLSGRPWDNSYMPPAQPGDVLEEHPYHFSNPGYKLAQLAKANPAPWGRKGDGHGVIINEYGWLWLNRDGTPTTLTEKLYANLLGTNSTTAQRRQLYARYTAAETEFWRAHRTAAAVLHFTTLGYSRPDGQTSDHWLDVAKLEWEPEFYKYVRDAFAPVGLMIDAWAASYTAGQQQDFPVGIINDLETPWKGYVQFRLVRDGKDIAEQTLPAEAVGLGTNRVSFTVAIPDQPGEYQAVATLLDTPCGAVHSLRDFSVLTAEQIASLKGIAFGKRVTASSSITRSGATGPEAVVDGDPGTRWSSEFSDPQWLAIDLGAPTKISGVELVWEGAYATAYAIQVSNDGQKWTDVYKTKTGKGGTDVIRFAPVETRWVRYFGTQRGTQFGHSLWEFRVFP